MHRTRGSLASRGVVGTMKRAMDEFRRKEIPNAAPLVPQPSEHFTPFAVPASDTPQVSIVIPVFNKIAYTAACLRSLAEHAEGIAFETIVVDDGSTDATAQRLAQIDGIRVHRNAQNLGFVGSCNAGAAMARGEFVVFLNNDTVVTAGWLRALLDCFAQEPDAGLVGSKLVYPDGRLQEAGGIVFSDGSGWNYGRFGDPSDPRYNMRREADYCSGAAIMLPRALLEKLGGFDTRYAPAYYEDTDLAFAVRESRQESVRRTALVRGAFRRHHRGNRCRQRHEAISGRSIAANLWKSGKPRFPASPRRSTKRNSPTAPRTGAIAATCSSSIRTRRRPIRIPARCACSISCACFAKTATP